MADAACDYCLVAISFEAPHKGPCGVKDSIAHGWEGGLLVTTDITDEDIAAKSDDDLLTDFVRYNNHSSHLRESSQRWSNDAKRVYWYLRNERGVNADEILVI
jgi:hypothetical protein